MEDTLAEIRRDNLQRFMEDNDFKTSKSFSVSCGISPSTIGNYRSGKIPVSNKSAQRMCEHFELGFGWFDTDRRKNEKLDYPEPAAVEQQFLNMRCWSDDGKFDITLKIKKDTAREFILDLFES